MLGTEDVNVGLGESCIAKALRHSLGSRSHAARGVGGIDLDQLLEDVVRDLPGGVVDLCLRRGREKQEAQGNRSEENQPFDAVQLGLLRPLNRDLFTFENVTS